jgi:transposase InsO family protein
MDNDQRLTWALWRYSILGPLVSARLEHGDRAAYIKEAAARYHTTPEGKEILISARTIEEWFYLYKKGGLEALKNQPRSDRGRTHIRPEIQERLITLKREKPRRSIRRLIKMLVRTGEVKQKELSRSSVQRFLKSQGLSARSRHAGPVERRAFRHGDPGDLWMGDVLHGPPVIAGNRVCKSYVIAFIDSATRFVPSAEVRLSESAPDHEYALKQALLKHPAPRALYLDNGPAQRSISLKIILAELSIRLIHTKAYCPEAKGAIEKWNRTFRDEVEDELPGEPLPIEELQSRVWSWLAVEYNARVHETTGKVPLEDWLSDPEALPTLPKGVDLDEIFLHRDRRKVRKDSTIRFKGRFLEVCSSLIGKWIELRYHPFEEDSLPRVFFNGKFVCDTVPLDRVKNAARKRHRPKSTPPADLPPSSGLDALRLMQEEQLKRTRPPTPPPRPAVDHDNDEDEDEDDDNEQEELSYV